MANTYESKFKGAEVDEGVNIARNLAGTGGIDIRTFGTGINTVKEIDGSGKQDKLTVSSNVHINSLTIAATSATGLYFTNETGAGISYRILVAASSGTAPLARLMVPNDIAGKTQTIATREYVNAHSSSYNPGSGIDISGNTISLAKHIMVNDITLGNYSSGNVILLPQSGASGNVYFPKYGGTLATTNEVPAVVQIMGTGTTTVMSQKAVTDELGKKQDKITDQTSLNVGALTAKGYSSLNGIYVDNSTTKPICFKRNGSIVTKMYGPTSGGGELVNVYLPGKGGTLALTSDIPTGGGGSAGVSSIGGKTGAITLGTGLSMNGNELSAEGGGGTTYYQHLLRSKFTHGSCDYQFYMTVISTQSSEAGGLTELVLNSANITVGIDAAQSGAPQNYAGFVPAIMIDNPDAPTNSTIFFVDTINNRSYAVAVEDTEFISDSVETL